MRALFAGELDAPRLDERPEDYVPLLRLALADDALAVRGPALTILGFAGAGRVQGTVDASPLAPLAEAVRQSSAAPDAREREAAYGALVAFPHPATTEALVRGTRDPELRAAYAAVYALGMLGPEVRPAAVDPVVAAARSALAAGQQELAGSALHTLGWLHRDGAPLPADAVAVLRRALGSGDAYLIQQALMGAREAGPGAEALRRDIEAVATAPPAEAEYLGPSAQAALRRLDGAPSTSGLR